MNRPTHLRGALCLIPAGALVLAAVSSASAGTIPSSVAAVKSAASNTVTDVRWRGRWGGAVAAGVIGGLALGALAATPGYYGYGYAPYHSGYGYAPTYYGYGGYVGGPPYSAYAYNYYNPTQCYIEGGYGRRMGC
jgi:hypothetical protein